MDDSAHRSRVKEIFHQAVSLAGEDRSEYLRRACGQDADLLAEVRGLLEADADVAESFLEPADVSDLAVGRELGHHRIEGPLGRGGMGAVYRARDLQLDRSVALKVLPTHLAEDTERLRRFTREAKSLAALSHPNIVTVFSVEPAAPIPYLTMELVEGETLASAIPRGGLPFAEVLRVGGATL